MEENKKKEKALFITRAIAWFLLAGVLPFVFISYKFGLFSAKSGPNIQLSGWAILGVITIGFTLLKLAKYIYKGMEQGLLKQCIHGIITVILPLVILYAILKGIKGNIDTLETILGCVIVCETIAVPLNPFPEWVAKKYQGGFEGIVDVILNKTIKRNENK